MVNPLTGLAALIIGHVSSVSEVFGIKCLKTQGVLLVTEPGYFGNVRVSGLKTGAEVRRPVSVARVAAGRAGGRVPDLD